MPVLLIRSCSPRRGTLLAVVALFGFHLILLSTRTIDSSRFFLTAENDVFIDGVHHQYNNSDWNPTTTTSGTDNLGNESIGTVGQEGLAANSPSVAPNISIQDHNDSSVSLFHSTRQQANASQSPSTLQQEFPYTPAQQCRLELEKWLNPQIDEFLQMGEEMPPLIDWVWDMGDHFVINMRFHELFRWNRDAFLSAQWNWQDQFGNNFTISGIWGRKRKKNVRLPCIKVPPLHVTNQTERSVPVHLWASNIKVPENKSVRHWVYDLRPYLKCDHIEKEIDRPPPGTKIGMCVRFRGAHHLIPPFIAYHSLIGVEHFWFYANEEFDISDLPAAPYLTYVPYRFVWTEHVMHSRQRGEDGIERPWRLDYNGDNFWQIEALQQCLYRLKRYGLDWLMTNDVDEYLWLNETESMGVKPTPSNTSILQEFLLPYEDKPEIGGLAVEGWAFGANEIQMGKTLDLQIDYVHRADRDTGGRRKIIYRVPTAKRISIHWLYEGGELLLMPISKIRWNHYRSPYNGVHQRRKFPIVRDSSLPDAYRSSIVEALQGYVYPGESKTRTTTTSSTTKLW